MADLKSRVLGTATKIQMPGEDPFLIIEVEIDCDLCGQGTIRLPGHHLKSIRDLFIQWCDEFPDLTGGTVTKIADKKFAGTAPADPSVN